MFISAHAKPQLHRFSLARFAARTREISNNAVCRSSHIHTHTHPQPSMRISLSRMTASRNTSAARCAARSTFVIPLYRSSLTPYPSPRALGSGFFISPGHVYPTRGKRATKENVSPRRGQIQPRARRSRNGFRNGGKARDKIFDMWPSRVSATGWNVGFISYIARALLSHHLYFIGVIRSRNLGV